jgi:hypothetical protein
MAAGTAVITNQATAICQPGYHSTIISPRVQVDMLNLHHRQLIEAALICLKAIGRTEPHSEIAMEYQAE